MMVEISLKTLLHVAMMVTKKVEISLDRPSF